MKDIIQRINDYSLEELMGERFARYSKYIIQDRALPDVRDGLKPVQRRILYGMYKERNTYDKAYRKSAKTVGNIMGNYHPHGDSSIYDAMVRMSQWWKQNLIYIDMQGNNGSMDGDTAAAMRYTEARLAKISNELLKDLERDTVIMAPNFDDTEVEPTVLPAKFPNLLVGGSAGISAGYATNIPPHNLGEVIDATIKRIDSPNCRLESILSIIKGPDFPTGGIALGLDGIKSAFETGKGRVVLRAKTEFKEVKGKQSLIITEIPFDVIKSNLVKKIDEIRLDKKIDGIIEVRDESDIDGLRIVVDLKKEVDKELILNYLLKNTDLQVNFNYNMVAIVNRTPKLLGILEILDAYIDFQKEVIIRRSEFDLAHAKDRHHIVSGLIKCLSILDEVIALIRSSKDKSNAIENLVKEYDFSEAQATAIVNLQLYRLTNTDIVLLEDELKKLNFLIKGLEEILADENKLKALMKDELRKIRNEYATARKTEIVEEVDEIKIDEQEMIVKEDVIVMVTKDGYVKKSSNRSYQASKDVTAVKEGDYPLLISKLTTLDIVLLFTNQGNYLYLPVYEIQTSLWKELGKHVSNIITLAQNEEIVAAIPVSKWDKTELVLATKLGMIKRTALKDYRTSRYSRPIKAMNLKAKDELLTAKVLNKNKIMIVTNKAYALNFDYNEVSLVGAKAAGVKAINLLKEDFVVACELFDSEDEYLSIITDKKTGKRIKLNEFEPSSRANRGLVVVRDVKSNPHKIINAFILEGNDFIGLKNNVDLDYLKNTELSIADRYSTGSSITKKKIEDAFKVLKLVEEKEKEVEETKVEKEKPSLKEIDDRLLTIDDFLKSKNN